MTENQNIDNIADAFFDIAKEDKNIPILLENAKMIRQVFDLPELMDIFLFSNLTTTQYKQHLSEILKGNVDPMMENLIYYAVDVNIIKSIDKIMTRFIRHCVHQIGAIYGEVFVVERLSEENIERIEKSLSKKLKIDVSLIQKIDKTLIAGIRIEKVRGHIFESSIAQQLRSFEELLKES